ncbi:MAG: acyl-CoA dehydrogenase family protein [Polyangiales bacterium]
MNFDLTDDQRMLVDSVATFVKKDSPISRFRAVREDEHGIGWSRDVLKKMGELGWLGLIFPEAVGGLGGSCIDLALVLEQLGTALVPEPILSSIVLGGLAVLRAGESKQHERWLPALIAGDKTLALAITEDDSRYDLHRIGTRAERTDGGYRLNGKKRFVLDGHTADAFVVSARTFGSVADPEGVSLFVVDREGEGVTVQRIKTMDGHQAAIVSFDGAKIETDRRLGQEGNALATLESVIDYAAACACAEGVGIMSTVLMMTRDYLCQREQFGVKIGTFQALQHSAVDMFVETELARSTMILGALGADEKDEQRRKRSVSAAKVQLATGGRFVTQQSIQLHGGIGITDEHDVGIYFKRMHVLNALFGDEEHHLRRFASLPGFAA